MLGSGFPVDPKMISGNQFRYQVQTLCVPVHINTAFYLGHLVQLMTGKTKQKPKPQNSVREWNGLRVGVVMPDNNKGDEAKKVDTRTLGVTVTEKT